MSLGRTQPEELFSLRRFCEEQLPERSVFRLLADEGHRLFPDEAFEDLYCKRGRCSIPPRILASVVTLQRYCGLSDREAVAAFTFDLRWKFACGALGFDYPGFDPTVLVGFRERLRNSKRPNRVFEAVISAAKKAGLVGRRRVLDSTAIYDAVSTQDTTTLVRSALVDVFNAMESSDPVWAQSLREMCKREDDYREKGKPKCDWDNAGERDKLIADLAHDGYFTLQQLEKHALSSEVQARVALLATVLGQDLKQDDDGTYRIERGVAKDRVISVVDPEARHGHKTESRHFDGYKGHIAIDPDSEIITATAVTSGNVGDCEPAAALIQDLEEAAKTASPDSPCECYGDASYGSAAFIEHLEAVNIEPNVKVQAPTASRGHFTQDAFSIDVSRNTATCPNGVTVSLHRSKKDGSRAADFRSHCAGCPLRMQCTDSPNGRTVRVHAQFETLKRHRSRQKDAAFKALYRSIRPKIERKIAHLMRRKHGGRRACTRSKLRVGYDFSHLAAAINLSRMAALSAHIPPVIPTTPLT
jgi:transposase